MEVDGETEQNRLTCVKLTKTGNRLIHPLLIKNYIHVSVL